MRLSDQAASFLVLETQASPMNDVCVSVLQGELTLADLQTHLTTRIHRLPKYRQVLKSVPFNLAHPLWVDATEFALANHTQEHELAAGSDFAPALDLAVSLSQQNLDRTKPLWRMHVVRGVPDMTLLVHVAHRALLDGTRLNDLAHILFDLRSAVPKVGAGEVPDWKPVVAASNLEIASQAISDNTAEFVQRSKRLRSFGQSSAEFVSRATESVTRFITHPITLAPWNRGWVGSERVYRYLQIPSADIRVMRRVLGGTVNDLVLTIVSEAAARYIAKVDPQSPGRYMRLMIPTTVRREDQDGVRGNRTAAVFPVFDLEPMDILERYRRVRWENEAIRQSREAQALQLLTELAPPLPSLGGANVGALFADTGLNFTTFNPLNFLLELSPKVASSSPMGALAGSMAGFNFTCTNLPGAKTQQYLMGLAVKDHLFLPTLVGNLGIAVCISTYSDSLTINFLCDPNLLNDPDEMMSHFQQVVADLSTATQQTPEDGCQKANS